MTQLAVEQTLLERNIPTMIHGHTHRPALHRFTIDGSNYERLVIGDWGRYGWFIELDASGARQYRFDLHSGDVLA